MFQDQKICVAHAFIINYSYNYMLPKLPAKYLSNDLKIPVNLTVQEYASINL
jgi:hypothetical protein